VPLLFCHTWPSSFIEVSKIINELTEPQRIVGAGGEEPMAFHVVVPSIPGFGFSDASRLDEFGVRETAAYFDGLMARLGYGKYVAHGTGW
jgi:pimeloyl-ACP methyl ester carboxylesterase